MKITCYALFIGLVSILAGFWFVSSASAQSPWVCQTGIEAVNIQTPRGTGLYDLAYQFKDVDDVVGSWGHIFDSESIFYPKETGTGDVMIRAFAHAGFSTQTGDSLLVTYDGGTHKRVYLPALSGYTELYVGDDGSTFYDEGFTALAQAALAPSPTPTPSVMGYKTPSPTPSSSPSPVGYFTPTPPPECYGAPWAEPGYITLKDSTPTEYISYEFYWSCHYDPEYIYNWWTSATDWLVISPSQGFGFDGQIFDITVTLGDTSVLGPGNTSYLCYFYDWLGWNTGCFNVTYAAITPIPTVSPVPSATPTPRGVVGDYDGDRTSDFAIYRASTGLWLIRGVTRVYFGNVGDEPVPHDYNGDCIWDLAYFRPSNALWKIRNQTSIYFGNSDNICIPGDYNGDSKADLAFFDPGKGLWKVRNQTRFYFGTSGYIPLPADYDGDGKLNAAYYWPAKCSWRIRNKSHVIFGQSNDYLLPADYNGDGIDDLCFYRPSEGVWKIRLRSQVYFGQVNDIPVVADFNGDGTSDWGYFRPSSTLWKVKDITRVYFGLSGDTQVTNPH